MGMDLSIMLTILNLPISQNEKRDFLVLIKRIGIEIIRYATQVICDLFAVNLYKLWIQFDCNKNFRKYRLHRFKMKLLKRYENKII